VGRYHADSRDGVVTAVSGTIAFKGMKNTWIGSSYDFGVMFSGSATHYHVNPRTGIWSKTVDQASGSGDFYTNAVSANASIYQQIYINSTPPGSWLYSGNESDSYSYYSSDGDDIQSESGPVGTGNVYLLG
jgi:hypothetical protein